MNPVHTFPPCFPNIHSYPTYNETGKFFPSVYSVPLSASLLQLIHHLLFVSCSALLYQHVLHYYGRN
jgi:hypothetical protein